MSGRLQVSHLRPAVTAFSARLLRCRIHPSMGNRASSYKRQAEDKAASSQVNEDTEYQKLQGKKVWLVSEQKEVDITSLWADDERQELAKQLNEGVLYKLQDAGVKLYLISIGPPERGFKFHELTGFPNEYFLADPDNVTYTALGFKDDTFSAFFSPETPKALWRRIQEDGADGLKKVLGPWIKKGFFIPPKNSQAKNQGGTLVFQGRKTLWRYDDPATSAHASPKDILREGLKDL